MTFIFPSENPPKLSYNPFMNKLRVVGGTPTCPITIRSIYRKMWGNWAARIRRDIMRVFRADNKFHLLNYKGESGYEISFDIVFGDKKSKKKTYIEIYDRLHFRSGYKFVSENATVTMSNYSLGA